MQHKGSRNTQKQNIKQTEKSSVAGTKQYKQST
jgi:hypothetical protein